MHRSCSFQYALGQGQTARTKRKKKGSADPSAVNLFISNEYKIKTYSTHIIFHWKNYIGIGSSSKSIGTTHAAEQSQDVKEPALLRQFLLFHREFKMHCATSATAKQKYCSVKQSLQPNCEGERAALMAIQCGYQENRESC